LTSLYNALEGHDVLFDGPSTVFCVAVVEWTVVMRPSMMVNFMQNRFSLLCGTRTRLTLSCMTFASGARQLVVQEALEMTLYSDL